MSAPKLRYAEETLLRLFMKNDEKGSEALIESVQRIVEEHAARAFQEGAKVAENAAVRAIQKYFADEGTEDDDS